MSLTSCVILGSCAESLSHVRLFATPWAVAHQASLSMGILHTRIRSGLPSPRRSWIFPTQGSNSGLLHCRQILYHLSHQGSPWSWVNPLICLENCFHICKMSFMGLTFRVNLLKTKALQGEGGRDGYLFFILPIRKLRSKILMRKKCSRTCLELVSDSRLKLMSLSSGLRLDAFNW